MRIEAITAHDLAGAVAAGRRNAKTEFRARTVRYDPARDAVEIVTTHDAGFLVPRSWIAAFAGLSPDQFAGLEVWPDGSAIEIDALDIHVSVHGLLTQILPEMLPARAIAALFASRGGKATSPAKTVTARENGRKGGRPRRAASPEAA